MTALSFDFKDCDGTSGLRTGAAISGYSTVPRSPHGAFTMQPAYGHLVVLNGVDLNQQVTDFGTWLTKTTLLVSPAPFGTLLPMVGGIGEGRVRGDGYKWIFRFKNSATGEVTGFSALDPVGTSLGVSLTAGGFVGQDAFFTIPTSRNLDGAYMDVVQVFRNTTLESSVFYLEKELTGAGSSGAGSVFFHDDKTDDDLLLSGAETAALVPNPSFSTGVPDPRAKAFLMSNGRTALYGLVRMGPWACGATATLTLDSQIVVTDVQLPPERVQQRFLPTGATDNTQYRVCDVRPANTGAANEALTFAIYPAWKGASTSLAYEIADDRDARTVLPSRPGLPTQFDATEQFGVGGDQTDELLHMTEMRGTTYAFTREGIFAMTGIAMTDAAVPVVPQRIASEGPCGLRAAADTPVGVVYAEAQRGMRIFSGGYSTLYGSDPPKPLGGSSASASFGPLTQFRAIDPDYLGKTRVLYDATRHRVYVAYCPLGGGGVEECLAYQYEDETQNAPSVWRGPWRIAASCLFNLRDDAGGERVCIGDESGNVSTADDAVVDVLDTDSGQSVAGTIATVPNAFMFTASAGAFDPSSDKRVVGVPVVFTTVAGVVTVNRIAGFDGTNFVLLFIPATPLVAGTTFAIGAIRWQLTGAWLDGGEPILPHMLERVRMRLARAASGASTAELAASSDGGATFQGEDGSAFTLVDPAPTVDGVVTTIVYHDGRLHREILPGENAGGRAHQIRLRGTSVDGHPRVDAAVADIEIRGGA